MALEYLYIPFSDIADTIARFLRVIEIERLYDREGDHVADPGGQLVIRRAAGVSRMDEDHLRPTVLRIDTDLRRDLIFDRGYRMPAV